MASEIRVNKIENRSGLGTVTFADTGVDLAGITTAATLKVGTGVTASSDGDIFATGVCTATSFSGDGSALTGIDLGAVTGATGDFSIADKIVHTGDTNTAIRFPTGDAISAETGGSEALRIDSSQRLLLGHTSSQSVYATAKLQIQGTDGNSSSLSLLRHGNSPYLVLGSSGGSSLGDVTALSNGNRIGQVTFAGADGSDIATHAASMAAYVDGSVGSSSVPARISFQFGSSETEKLRINSDGDILHTSNNRNYAFWYKSPTNTSSNAASSNDEVLTFGTSILANSAYDTSNGRYTAPIDGLYFIRFNGLLDNNAGNQGHRASVYVNGSQYGDRIAYQQTNDTIGGIYHQMSGTGIVYMSANDYVQIHCTAGIHVSGETQFLGYLIRATV